MSGPYDTEAQAAAEPVPTALRTRVVLDPFGVQRDALVDACRAAGVELGAYDLRVLAWLARWEPATVQVVADLIRRAHRNSSTG